MKDNSISFFKTKEDLYLNFDKNTDHFIIITGVSGSGKSTLANEYLQNSHYDKVSLDLAFWHERSDLTKTEEKLVIEFQKKYPEWNADIFQGYADNLDNIFREYANLFYDFVIEYFKQENKMVIIEGSHIFKYIDIDKVKSRKMIIKRTSFFKSSIRKYKRIIKYANKDLKNKNIGMIKYFKELLAGLRQATIKQIKWYKKINSFIHTIYN